MSDTTTTLNTGTGGDVMDETAVVQADGTTNAKRARVDLGFDADDARGRLVGKHVPLPVEMQGQVLLEILTELREIKELLATAILET